MVRRATTVLKPIAQARDVAFIMNDRPDLAAELDCDGVHVGEEDMPYAEARRLLGPDRIVGVTCGDSRDRRLPPPKPAPITSPSARFFRA